MALMLRCILYPGSELFITTGGKEQAASITVAKIEEICKLIPALNNEINWERGQSKKSKDNVEYIFKNAPLAPHLSFLHQFFSLILEIFPLLLGLYYFNQNLEAGNRLHIMGPFNENGIHKIHLKCLFSNYY